MKPPLLSGGPWATGIGSLPFTEESAARELLRRFEHVPFLPELPSLDPDDALIRRPFRGVRSQGAGVGILAAALPSRVVVTKVQVAGPNVLAKHADDERGAPLRDSPGGRELAFERSLALARELLALLPDRRVLLVFDEPGLGAADRSELARAVREARKAGSSSLSVGVHDCGPDFRLATSAEPDVILFDLATYGDSIRGEGDPLAAFVREGNALGFGVVPTLPGAIRRFEARAAVERVRRAASTLMGSAEGGRALLDRSLVTPACGTALHSPGEAVSVHEAALEVARLLRERS